MFRDFASITEAIGKRPSRVLFAGLPAVHVDVWFYCQGNLKGCGSVQFATRTAFKRRREKYTREYTLNE